MRAIEFNYLYEMMTLEHQGAQKSSAKKSRFCYCTKLGSVFVLKTVKLTSRLASLCSFQNKTEPNTVQNTCLKFSCKVCFYFEYIQIQNK